MNPVQAQDPASHVTYTFTDVGALHNAIKQYGYQPVHADGSPFETQYLQEYDGYILDGAPINVWIDGEWLEGQKEALQPYWASGQIRQPAPAILNAGVVPMPPEVQERTAAAQAAAKGGGLFGMDTGTLLTLGAAGVALWWLSKGGGRGSRYLD